MNAQLRRVFALGVALATPAACDGGPVVQITMRADAVPMETRAAMQQLDVFFSGAVSFDTTAPLAQGFGEEQRVRFLPTATTLGRLHIGVVARDPSSAAVAAGGTDVELLGETVSATVSLTSP